uniref:Cytochrome b5 heme-binding domain-containing protein n=1 Tax=viral metagenome TaxID=1070528 RepID=A0A6C0KT83_9ZZZZ
MTNTQKNKTNKTNHNATNIYDLVIIGGGISGLYTLYKLSSKYAHLKILLLESGQRYGGRIYSYKETIDKQEYVMDLGAGRLGYHHKLINSLINELGLKPKLIPIPNTKTYIEVAANNKVSNKTSAKDYIMDKLTKFFFSPLVSKLGKTTKQSYYLYEFLTKYVSASFSRKVEDVFEYSSDLNELNAYDAIEYFKYDYNKTSDFFTLNGGLEQIIERLLQAIKKTRAYKSHNIKLQNLSNVENITYKKNDTSDLFEISVANYNSQGSSPDTLYSKYVICAIPKKSLTQLTIFKPLLSELNSINSINLLRIYEIYDKEQDSGSVWFKNIEKTITNTNVQFVIPVSSDNGLIMSSYSDCANARYWNNLLTNKGLDYVKVKLNEKLNLLFSIYNIKVPLSKYIKMYFWDAGVACWKKDVDSDYLSVKLLNPYPRVFIIGENYSKYQAWCEGALMTSESCIAKLVKILAKAKAKTLKRSIKRGNNKPELEAKVKIEETTLGGSEKKAFTLGEVKKHNKKNDAWTIIENKVYDITSWIPTHPGGDVILKAVGKNGTRLFKSVNHPSFVKENVLPKYYIGNLSK